MYSKAFVISAITIVEISDPKSCSLTAKLNHIYLTIIVCVDINCFCIIRDWRKPTIVCMRYCMLNFRPMSIEWKVVRKS